MLEYLRGAVPCFFFNPGSDRLIPFDSTRRALINFGRRSVLCSNLDKVSLEFIN